MDTLFEWSPAVKRGEILTAIGVGAQESPEWKRATVVQTMLIQAASPDPEDARMKATAYQRIYRRAEVLDRWANIYGGDTTQAAAARLGAACGRLGAELIKAARVEEVADWLGRRMTR